MGHWELEFQSEGGIAQGGFPALHAAPYTTSGGTPYFRQPGVVLIARPDVRLSGMGGFLDAFAPELGFDDYLRDPVELTPGLQLSKAAGQTCYLSFGPRRSTNKVAARYVENIKRSGHGSVLEHAMYSFLLYGISRSLTHELVRHRAGTAFSQTSQRYVDANVLRFVERPEYQSQPSLHTRFEGDIDRARDEYRERADLLLELQGNTASTPKDRTERRKRVQQAARSCLPNETEAPMVFSANVRALRHIIEMRASAHAEPEIRVLFSRVFLCMSIAEPVLFEDYSLVKLPDGTHEVTTPFRKV